MSIKQLLFTHYHSTKMKFLVNTANQTKLNIYKDSEKVLPKCVVRPFKCSSL